MIPIWWAVVTAIVAFAAGCVAGKRVADHYYVQAMNDVRDKLDQALMRMKYGTSDPLHIEDQGRI